MRTRVPFFCKKKLIKLFKKIELQVSTGDGENSVLPHKIRARFLGSQVAERFLQSQVRKIC